jgi:hypothetical protein
LKINFIFFRYGNWIFVNFPYDNEIWTILNEKNIRPDDILVLQDSTSQLNALQKRWYKSNRTEIDKEIHEREEREANERRIRDEERKRQIEEMKLLAEKERKERLAERQRKIDAGEPLDDEEDEAAEKGLIKNLNLYFFIIFYMNRNGTSYS